MNRSNEPRVDLKKLFADLQEQVAQRLTTNRGAIWHSGTKGDATEINWVSMLAGYLPGRYSVAKAFVIDADGKSSDQIDVVIYDALYCPLLFNQDGAKYIPAESVYAVLEAKQSLSKGNIDYAASKVSSVRRLRRTSARIPHAGGVFDAKPLFQILGGIIALDAVWVQPIGDSLRKCLEHAVDLGALDLGCALQAGSFEATYPGRDVELAMSTPETALIFFLLRLTSRLQALGTVSAIDISEYARVIGR